MNKREFFNVLTTATKLEEVRSALAEFRENEGVTTTPFGGRANNRGAIEVAADPARSAIERVTNEHDALLELEHANHGGIPECRSPREAADAWFGVPAKDGLAGLTTKQRQTLAANALVRLDEGEGWQSRVLTVMDKGIGIAPARMKDTILSLNESNKISKHYLAGTYGQGGSSTLRVDRTPGLSLSRAVAGLLRPYQAAVDCGLDPNENWLKPTSAPAETQNDRG